MNGVFSCAQTKLECTVSALITGATISFTLIKHAWLRSTEFAPASLDVKAWKIAVLIAVPVVAAEFCIGVSNAYPGAILDYVSEFEGILLTAAAGLALVGSLLCLWKCQQSSTNPSDDATQVRDFHERIAAAGRIAGLFIIPLNAAYLFYFANVAYPVFPILLFPWLLMTPPSCASGKLFLKVCCFVLLPCHMVFLRFLNPASVLQSMTLIPPSMGIPTAGALLHNSVGEQLSVALFVNAIVLYCVQDPAVYMLSAAMTALSSVAVVVKNRLCAHHLRRLKPRPKQHRGKNVR